MAVEKKCILKKEEILALLRLQKTPSIGDILATILLQLELKGIVKPIQGKIFKLS